MPESERPLPDSTREPEPIPAVNLLTDFDAVMDALTNMEGEEWRDEMERADRRNWENRPYRVLQDIQGETEEDRSTQVIYGAGGFRRYMVRGDGTVCISASHARNNKEILQKARDLGIETWD